ncbi:hypothetical protein L5876_00025 [Hyphobacterium sp. SN044]|uniref:hypothetical protein n=1 Tax=Hyphobacterium sp. SN044 TaxID=2912575 RepID=UPI001F329CC9|nr:hypothetical protein [Hyphobacterium sp. SN044]MCF8878198.1 hypothetical protein [Hyphobacterium sp. SN044]
MTTETDAPVRGEPFFAAMGWLQAALVFAGFAPTYFLRDAALPPLSMLMQVHGAIFTVWILLVAIQASLIPAGRVLLHMKLGLASIGLMAVMVPLGFVALVDAYARGASFMGSAETFVMLPLFDIVGLAVFWGLGVLNRHRPDWHKRFMLLAGIYAILPATARIGHAYFDNAVLGLILQMAIFAVFIGYDLFRRKAVHPVTLIVLAAAIGRTVLLFTVGTTEAWASLVRGILG